MNLRHAAREMQAQKEAVLAAVNKEGWRLQYAPEELRANREVVLAAVRKCGWALKYASEELRANREVVLAAVRKCGIALQFASMELQADREVVLAAVTKDGHALDYAVTELRADREVVLAAVRQEGEALQCASGELRADREVVLAVVKKYGDALQYASEELRADRDVVLTAVEQDGNALQYASEELSADRDVVITAVEQNEDALQYASEELRADLFRKRPSLWMVRHLDEAPHTLQMRQDDDEDSAEGHCEDALEETDLRLATVDRRVEDVSDAGRPSDVLQACTVETLESRVVFRRRIIALASRAPYVDRPELHQHAVSVADTLMGAETVVRSKVKDNAEHAKASRLTTKGGIMNFAYTRETSFQTELIEPLKTAYGQRAWAVDIPLVSRAGTDYVSTKPANFTRTPVHEDWQLDCRDFPRVLSFLEKGWMLREWMHMSAAELAALPDPESVDDELTQANTHLVYAKALDAYKTSKGFASADSGTEAIEALIAELEHKKERQEHLALQRLKVRFTMEALRHAGIPALHQSTFASYMKTNEIYLAQHPSSICMPDTAWPVHPDRDVDFFVGEVRKLVSRVNACNLASVGRCLTNGDSMLQHDSIEAHTALKRKMVSDPAFYDKVREILELPPSKRLQLQLPA